MRKFIRHGKFDAVLSFLEAPNFICEVSGFPFRKWKLVVGERSAKPGIRKSPMLILLRWFHFFADSVVANSYANLKLVCTANPFLSKSSCKVIFNAIDFNFWQPSGEYTPRKDSKLKLVIIGSHKFLKNLNGLINALLLLPEPERNKLSVNWYGDRLFEPYFDNSFPEAKLKISKFRLDELVTFYPATKEITQKIQEADAIGLFSFYEGLPNIVCEAMACGKPIICSAISDLPDLLSDDKNLLFNPNEPQSIKQALTYLINLSNDQLVHLGSLNLAKAYMKFDKEMIVTNYLRLLGRSNHH